MSEYSFKNHKSPERIIIDDEDPEQVRLEPRLKKPVGNGVRT